jgi:phospholipid/cholesterol/gamma-HCH transport system substrate-binding protein
MNRIYRIGALLVVVGLLVATGMWFFGVPPRTSFTAYFSKAVGLYAGSTVRILGVEVGRVDRVQPQGADVRVDMSVDPGVQVPAAAKAVVVAPSLVSDRYVQLTPAYTGGPVLAANATIPLQRTATPVELDDLYRSADQLSAALGPNGANQNGALSNLLNAGAANLDGNGQSLQDTVHNLSGAADALQGSQGDLFSTVDNLDKFTRALAQSDQQIHEFNGQFSDVTGFLAGDSRQLGSTLGELSGSLDEVQRFVQDNRGLLESNVHSLTGVSKALADQRGAIAELLDVAPLAASNFINSYDAASGTVAVRLDLNEFTYPPVMMVCLVLEHSTPKVLPQTLSDICKQLAPVIDGTLKLPNANEIVSSLQQGKPPPLPLPLLDVLTKERQGSGPR